MILGSSEIIKRIETDNLITDLGNDFKIEGCLVDLRLDSAHIVTGTIELFNDRRNTGSITPVGFHFDDDNKREVFVVQPNTIYLVSTIETVNMPSDLAMYISRRSTIFRSGLSLDATFTNPGYKGKLTFLLINNNKIPVTIERGFRIVQVGFFEIKGSCELYNGNWQNGKISSNGNFDPPR